MFIFPFIKEDITIHWGDDKWIYLDRLFSVALLCLPMESVSSGECTCLYAVEREPSKWHYKRERTCLVLGNSGHWARREKLFGFGFEHVFFPIFEAYLWTR